MYMSVLVIICCIVRYSFSVEDARLMASMGYNTIRLGVLWAGLEPERGSYNLTYLDQVVACVDIAERHGLHPVLDMHQARASNEGS